jgi:branched-chain amino acid transport system ATP-binding protein
LGISQVPEGRQPFAHLRVLDTIHLATYLYHKRRRRAEINEQINAIYKLLPILKHRSKQLFGTLSGVSSRCWPQPAH